MLTLVLIPGLLSDAASFAEVMPDLSRRCHVLVANVSKADSVEEMAGAVLAASPQRFALLGFSLGGMVALEVIRIAPERVRGLCLAGSSLQTDDDAKRRWRQDLVRQAEQGGFAEVLRHHLLPRYFPAGAPDAERLEACHATAVRLGAQVFAGQFAAIAHRRVSRASLRAYAGPTLLLHGDNDALSDAACNQAMQQLQPHAWVVAVPDASHLVLQQKPAECLAAIQAWLAMLED